MAAIHLIRHGQACFGEADYDQLSATGIEQACLTGAALRAAGVRIGLAVRGSLRRHRQSAEFALDALGIVAQPVVDAGWDEFDHHGVIAALRPDYTDPARLRTALMAMSEPRLAFQLLFEEALARWVGGQHDGDYRESWRAFGARCMDALEKLRGHAVEPQADIVVFTSGGPIAALAQALLGMPDRQAIELTWSLVNCGITKLIAGRRGVRLSTLNAHAHFEGDRAPLLTYR